MWSPFSRKTEKSKKKWTKNWEIDEKWKTTRAHRPVQKKIGRKSSVQWTVKKKKKNRTWPELPSTRHFELIYFFRPALQPCAGAVVSSLNSRYVDWHLNGPKKEPRIAQAKRETTRISQPAVSSGGDSISISTDVALTVQSTLKVNQQSSTRPRVLCRSRPWALAPYQVANRSRCQNDYSISATRTKK